MLKEILGIGGAIGTGVVTYIVAYRKGHKTGKVEGFESGTQVGFTMAPALYNQMRINGDIDSVPIGMNLGEQGRVFNSPNEARDFVIEATKLTGCKYTDFDIFEVYEKTGKVSNFTIVSLRGALRKG